ncbi:MAG: hypothetical protein ACFFDT_14895 [Candidatus Hodarchaeota archaeon]
MPTERERIHGEVLRRQVVTYVELVDIVRQAKPKLSKKDIQDIYIEPLVKQRKLLRIRRGLFLGIPLGYSDDQIPNFNKFLVAAKFRYGQSILAYHSALEFYGCAYNTFDEVFLGVKTKFAPFTVCGIKYRPVFLRKPDLHIKKLTVSNNVNIRVTSRERTFIDCINQPKYAGGWEESLKSLESLNGIDFKKLLELIDDFSPSQLLIRKTGYILDLLRDHSMYYEELPQDLLKRLELMVSSSKIYLDRNRRGGKNVYISRWRLFVPSDFKDNLRGI